MLPRAIRLNTKKSFDDVRNRGKLSQGEFVGISYRNRGDQELTKIGSIISTKISKKAVERNRIKRAINEASNNFYKNLPAGYDFVIMAKRNIVDVPNTTIITDVLQTFERLTKNFRL